jgi:hypothetical protein
MEIAEFARTLLEIVPTLDQHGLVDQAGWRSPPSASDSASAWRSRRSVLDVSRSTSVAARPASSSGQAATREAAVARPVDPSDNPAQNPIALRRDRRPP